VAILEREQLAAVLEHEARPSATRPEPMARKLHWIIDTIMPSLSGTLK
jgi:hypothetical protein